VQGRPAAPRRPGRGAARSGDAPAWETGEVVLGMLRSRVGLLGGTGPQPKRQRKGLLGNDVCLGRTPAHGRPPACSGLQHRRCAGRPVHCLYRRARQRDGEGQRGQVRGRPGNSVRHRAGEDVRRRDVRRPRHAHDVGKVGCVGKGRGDLGRRAGGPDAEAGGAGAAGARESALSAVIYLGCLCSTAIFSRNLNRSAQSGQ
jgi:hypothetical protein